MTVDQINEGINRSIRDTNTRTNRSIEIRSNHNNNYMQERLKKLDALCLSIEERAEVGRLNEAEMLAFKESKKYAGKTAWNSFKAVTGSVIGSSFGVIGAADNMQRYNASEDNLNKINTRRDEIRQKAQDRYEKAMGLSVDAILDGTDNNYCYDR